MANIEFKINKQKAIEIILFLANKRPSLDKMSLYKFLFFADIEHLNKYERPICGDFYVAMPYGPVPSQIKDLIEKKHNEDNFVINDYMITALRPANEEYLSQSDIDILNETYDRFKDCSAMYLSDLSHKHIAWKNARRRNPFKNNNKIDYKDLIFDENKDIIEDLECYSKGIVF